MTNERTPDIISSLQTKELKLMNFPKFLAKNEQNVYSYILLMVKGKFKAQNDNSDYIFAHLKNVIHSEMNSRTLKYASRFIITLMLLGHVHTYQRFIAFLLPVFKAKIVQNFKDKIKPIWPVQEFCREILYMLSQWLPYDLYDKDQPSAFVTAIHQLNIQFTQLTFLTLEKLIISHKIIKSLQLQNLEECECECCKKNTVSNYKMESHFVGSDLNNKKMRQYLYLMQYKSQKDDKLWKTGFQIEVDNEVDLLSRMLDLKLQFFRDNPQHQHQIYSRKLNEKIQFLEGNITDLNKQIKQSQKKGKNMLKSEKQMTFKGNFQTPVKLQQIKSQKQIRTADSHKKIKGFITPKNIIDNFQHITAQNIQEYAAQAQFQYRGYPFFQNIIKLQKKYLNKFKNSLLRFDQKIYLYKNDQISISCISVVKSPKIKIRIKYNCKNNIQQNYNVYIDSNLQQSYNETKSQFAINLNKFQIQPIKVAMENQGLKIFIEKVLPIGYIKFLEPLQQSAKEIQKLAYKYKKTIKITNQEILNYQYIMQRLLIMGQLVQKIHEKKILRLFQEKKLRKCFERRYKIFGHELFLRLLNNNTKYVDVQIFCQDKSCDRRLAGQLLKQLIFICTQS